VVLAIQFLHPNLKVNISYYNVNLNISSEEPIFLRRIRFEGVVSMELIFRRLPRRSRRLTEKFTLWYMLQCRDAAQQRSGPGALFCILIPAGRRGQESFSVNLNHKLIPVPQEQ